MLKTTSVVSVIASTELLESVQLIYARTYQTIPLLIVARIWYLLVTSLLSTGQYYPERYVARGSPRPLPPTPRQRLLPTAAFRSASITEPRGGGQDHSAI
jgi:polar amino acid transport system permease protein